MCRGPEFPQTWVGRLQPRFVSFGAVIKKVPRTDITRPLITQLVKCATSVGANYCEADDAESGRDFRHKIGICKKEAREAKHFLRMLAKVISDKDHEEVQSLWQEAKELNLIFNKIYLSCKENERKRKLSK